MTSNSDVSELQLVEKEIDGGNPTVPCNDEISTGVSRRLARAALYPLDPTAIAHAVVFDLEKLDLLVLEPEAIDSKRYRCNAGKTRRGANLSISQQLGNP